MGWNSTRLFTADGFFSRLWSGWRGLGLPKTLRWKLMLQFNWLCGLQQITVKYQLLFIQDLMNIIIQYRQKNSSMRSQWGLVLYGININIGWLCLSDQDIILFCTLLGSAISWPSAQFLNWILTLPTARKKCSVQI